jgi:hypothetical protein
MLGNMLVWTIAIGFFERKFQQLQVMLAHHSRPQKGSLFFGHYNLACTPEVISTAVSVTVQQSPTG